MTRRRLLRSVLCLLLNTLAITIYGQEVSSSIAGTVIEKITGQPVPGAAITVLTTKQTTISDSAGKFIFHQVALGKHDLEVKALGYKPLIVSDQLLSAGKNLDLNIQIDQQSVMMKELVIMSNRTAAINSAALVSARGVDMEQTNRYAGNFGDISRQVSNFAGVNVQGDIRNDIVVRGNSPNNLLWRLEGIDIPNPNHFSFVGTTGGYFSVLNNNMLATSDFITGAFPAEYGNKNGAVFDVRLKKGNAQNREYTFQAGLNGLEMGVEGPLSRVKGSSFIGHYRYFDLAGVKKLGIPLKISGLPSFQDVNFKIHLPNKKGSASIFGLGGLSTISLLESQKSASDWSFSDKAEDLKFSSNMGVLGYTNTHLWNSNTTSKLAFAVSGNKINAIRTLVPLNEPAALKEDLHLSTSQVQLKFDLTRRFTAGNSLKSGLSYTEIFYKHFQKQLNDAGEYEVPFDTRENTGLAQGYVNYQHRFDRITINTGIYSQLLMLNNTFSIEPRVALQYQMASRQTISFAYGQHSQAQSLIFYTRNFLHDNQLTQTNKNLKFSRSSHWVLSHEYTLNSNTKLKSELYYQALSKLPVSRTWVVYSVINEGHDYSFEIPDSLENTGTGRNYGVEISFEKTFTNNFYLLGTASVFDSNFKGTDNRTRNTIFNNNYVGNLLAGYEFATGRKKLNKLSFDLKATFSGGRPYIPIDLEASKAQNREVFDHQMAFEKRLPAYNRLDFKASWLFNRLSSNHLLYAGVNNILDSKNIMKYGYNADKGKIVTDYMQGLFPIFGYRLQF